MRFLGGDANEAKNKASSTGRDLIHVIRKRSTVT